MTCPNRLSVVCIWCAFGLGVLGYPAILIGAFS